MSPSERDIRSDAASSQQNAGDDADASPASAFSSDADYSMTRTDELRELYDRKFYAPLQILIKDYRGALGISILLLYILMGTVGVAVVPIPNQDGPRMLPWFRDLAFPLGTDGTGKSLLRMIVHATPRMLQMMLAGTIFSLAFSVGIGTLAGFKRGMTDRILMTVTDTALNLPGLPLLLVLVAVLQPSNPMVIGIILSINGWAGGARSLRSQVLQLRNADHVEASRAMGASTGRNIQKNVLPELMPLIMIRLMTTLRSIIFAAVGLYFLGVLPTNDNNWGVMLNRSYQAVDFEPLTNVHYLMVPLLTISLFGIGTIFLAQAFDRVFNPRLRAKYAKTLSGGDKDDDADAAASEAMLE